MSENKTPRNTERRPARGRRRAPAPPKNNGENNGNGNGTGENSQGGRLNILQLKEMPIGELNAMARDYNIEGAAGMRRQDLIFSLLTAQAERNGAIYGSGV
ncbi:MAG: Rho termination factor N-terminal domain-containing protein, partial [Deltaproteobacteria bacterium]|nr:Rho termination factor N-terminal domain-containing protein [Deltaproteobacteria bacterium]